MQYDVDNAKEYLNALDSDWRKETLLQLRDLILQQDANIDESINYKMLCYRLNGATVFHLNAQKGYVSLYCGDANQMDPDGTLLAGLNVGKGCIRFSKTKAVADTRIAEFIAKTFAVVKQGINVDC